MKTLRQKLSSEQCRRILASLKQGPKNAKMLVNETKLTAGSVAKHLEVLLEAEKVIRNSDRTYSLKR